MIEQEKLLIEAAQQDPRRFAELYEANFERVYAFIVRRVPNRTQAEDLTSEVFHHALANLSRFEWRGVPFAVWLYRIAANAIADRVETVIESRITTRRRWTISRHRAGSEIERRAVLVSTGRQPS